MIFDGDGEEFAATAVSLELDVFGFADFSEVFKPAFNADGIAFVGAHLYILKGDEYAAVFKCIETILGSEGPGGGIEVVVALDRGDDVVDVRYGKFLGRDVHKSYVFATQFIFGDGEHLFGGVR